MTNDDSVSASDTPRNVMDRMAALCRERNFNAADAIGDAAIRRFPEDRDVWLQYAMVALQRPDAPAAAARFEAMRARFPDFAPAYTFGALALRHANRVDDAEQLLVPAMSAFPREQRCFTEYAYCASHRGTDRNETIRRWQMVEQRFPECPEAYWMLAHQFHYDGSLEQAEAVIDKGFTRCPNDPRVLWQWALNATRRHAWEEAARRWDIAKARYPDSVEINDGIAEMRLSADLLRTEDIDAAAAVLARPSEAPKDGALGELLLRFESLGDNCEFGIVQRTAGVEPLGLLRWANINAAKLTKMLNTELAGVGEPQNTRLDANQFGEYSLVDPRYFGMHTFINIGLETPEKLLPKMLRRLRFLKDKLIQDLTGAEKIFVHKSGNSQLTQDEMRMLLAAIRRYGNGTLFCVQHPPEADKDMRVEAIGDGLIVGYLSKLTTNPLAARQYAADCYELARGAMRLAGG